MLCLLHSIACRDNKDEHLSSRYYALKAFTESRSVHALLCSILTVILWPGTTIIPITNEESKVWSMENPPAASSHQAAPSLNNLHGIVLPFAPWRLGFFGP